MPERRFDHERTDVPGRVPAVVVVVTVLAVTVSIVLVAGLVNRVWVPAPADPDLFGPGQGPEPAPALQQNPRADMVQLRRRWQRRLHSFGWVDRQAGIVHIPIDLAMDRIAEEGLPAEPRPGDRGVEEQRQ